MRHIFVDNFCDDAVRVRLKKDISVRYLALSRRGVDKNNNVTMASQY